MKNAFFFAAAALLSCGSAFAQARWDDSHSVFDGMGIHTDHAPIAGGINHPSQDLAVQAMHNFARCAANRSEPGAIKLLDMNASSAEHQRAVMRFAKGHDDCAPNSKIKFSTLLFEGGLAEQLIEEKAPGRALTAAIAYDAGKPQITAHNVVDVIGMCVVRKAPEETSALFATEPTSKDEDRALRAIGPALVSCVSTGQTMKTNREGLRAVLALSAYRLMRHNQTSMASVN